MQKEKHRNLIKITVFFVVRIAGLEPATPCMSSKYSNQLSYTLI